MIERFELSPKNGRASFYRKAMVEIDTKKGTETLLSYDTPIIRKKGNKIMRLFNGSSEFKHQISTTTCSHIISFCGLHKKDFLKLPYKKYIEL